MVTQTRPSARPRGNVGPPQFYGERRYVEENETLPRLETDLVTPPAFSCWSTSDLLTPLIKSPQIQTRVAETTVSWSSNNSNPAVAAHSVSMMSTSWKSPNRKSTTQFINEKDHESISETSLSIDQDVRHSLDEFDTTFNQNFNNSFKNHFLSS